MHGKMAAALYNIYAQTTNMRKVEHMDNHVFSQTAWNNEAGRRVLRLKEMFDGGNAIYAALPDQEKDAFFQMFLMKMHASYFTALEYYYADRSQLSYNRGNMAGADEYIRFSRKAAESYQVRENGPGSKKEGCRFILCRMRPGWTGSFWRCTGTEKRMFRFSR